MSTAATRRAYAGIALFSFGFRPFFLLGAFWSALVVPLWLSGFLHGGSEAFTRDWHVHEMIFGFLAAVMAGFLTTAIPNWTGRMPVVGAPLGALVALWVAGRVAMLYAPVLGLLASVIDSAFLITFAAVVWREVLAGRNWRNFPVCVLVSLFALANVAFHLRQMNGLNDLGVRLALGSACVLITLIGGRLTPSFTRNWLHARNILPEPAAASVFDTGVVVLTGLAAAAWVAFPDVPLTCAALLGAGAANLFRLGRWRGWAAAREPLVWILHLGYGWLAVGLLLLGAAVLDPALVPLTVGIHVVTAGAVGVMTLAVMTRATRGHTGRPLTADGGTTAIYLAINLAALLRVAAPFTGAAQVWLLSASGLAWTCAFAGFGLTYGRMLTTAKPRTL
jgi:uncharacterized protein involved in response to NO